MATEDEANTIFNNVAGYVLSNDGFPDTPPFTINSERFSAGDAPAPTENADTDLSASVWVTMDEFGFMYAYGEVTDDYAGFPGVNADGGGTWDFDSFEFFLGNYDVREVNGGGLLNGTPHTAYARGSEADFQVRMAVEADESGNILGIGIWSHADPNGATGSTAFGPVQGAGGVAGTLEDGSGNTIGYRFLVAIPLESIIDPSADQPLMPPSASELKVLPFNVAMNDRDEAGAREHQLMWSTRGGAGAWNNPSMWQTAAVVGRALATDVDDVESVLPFEFALGQNYPNPFNPSTSIEFSVANAAPVRLEVFNVLGQRVATLLNGTTMPAGQHAVTFDASELTSGMYIYRLQAGSKFSQTRTMMLLK
jgi:hypothetical protein